MSIGPSEIPLHSFTSDVDEAKVPTDNVVGLDRHRARTQVSEALDMRMISSRAAKVLDDVAKTNPAISDAALNNIRSLGPPPSSRF